MPWHFGDFTNKTTREKTQSSMVVCLKNSRKHISAAMAVLSPTSIAKKERKKATVREDFSGSLKGRWLTPHPGSFAAGLRLGWLYQLMWCTDLRGRRRNVEMSPRALEVEKNCFRLFSKMASQRGLVTSFTCLIQVSC